MGVVCVIGVERMGCTELKAGRESKTAKKWWIKNRFSVFVVLSSNYGERFVDLLGHSPGLCLCVPTARSKFMCGFMAVYLPLSTQFLIGLRTFSCSIYEVIFAFPSARLIMIASKCLRWLFRKLFIFSISLSPEILRFVIIASSLPATSLFTFHSCTLVDEKGKRKWSR